MNIQLKVILTMVMLIWLSAIEVNAQQAVYDTPRPSRPQTTTTATTKPRPPKRTVNTSSKTDEKITVNGITFKMVYVEGGKFTMGATNDQDNNCFTDEYPGHDVTISSFKIGETEVTQELWQAVMGSNPSYFKGPRLPVEKVSWEDCQNFIKKLNTLTGRNFRLPTEAEWEYAARGGKKSDDYLFSGSGSINDVAWFSANSGTRTHDVATSRSNGLGLYDMSGNVNEWCQDWYDSSFYSERVSSDPKGPSSGTRRVVRGGSWQISDRYCRVLYRHSRKPTDSNFGLGLRLAF